MVVPEGAVFVSSTSLVVLCIVGEYGKGLETIVNSPWFNSMNHTYWNSFAEAFSIHDYVPHKKVRKQEASCIIAPKCDRA
jgi:hypothetical protein